MSDDFGDDLGPPEKPKKPRQKLATTELGFVVNVHERERVLRGNYDTTRISADHPELCKLIAWLISLPGMTYQAIAEAAGISWETVAAIAATRVESIREFKLRQAKMLGLVLDAATPGLMARAARGELSAFDFKMLTDAWLQYSGEGNIVRVESESDPKRAALRRFLEDAGTVREAEEIPQRAAPALPVVGERGEPLPAPIKGGLGGIGDSESPILEVQCVGSEGDSSLLDTLHVQQGGPNGGKADTPPAAGPAGGGLSNRGGRGSPGGASAPLSNPSDGEEFFTKGDSNHG